MLYSTVLCIIGVVKVHMYLVQMYLEVTDVKTILRLQMGKIWNIKYLPFEKRKSIK